MDSETTYSLVRTWFGTGGLILMVVLFTAVLAYALWPANKKKFPLSVCLIWGICCMFIKYSFLKLHC